MSDAKNVSYAKPKIGGAISFAPVGTPLPKNAKEKLNSAFVNVGYCSNEGLSNDVKKESDVVKAWGGDTVANIDKGMTDTFKFKMIEALDINVLKLIFGDKNVTGDLNTGIGIRVNNKESESHSWVVDMILTGGILKRMVIADGKITDVGEITYKDDDTIDFDTTMTAYAGDESFDFDTHKEFIVKPTTGTGE